MDDWDDRSSDSSPYLSPLDDSDLDHRDALLSDIDAETEESSLIRTPPSTARARIDHLAVLDEGAADTSSSRRDLESLQASQYWRSSSQANSVYLGSFDTNIPESLCELLTPAPQTSFR